MIKPFISLSFTKFKPILNESNMHYHQSHINYKQNWKGLVNFKPNGTVTFKDDLNKTIS